MLDPWIIEEIRRREEQEERARREQRPVVEISYDLPVLVPTGKPAKEEKGEERGVVIVDFSI